MSKTPTVPTPRRRVMLLFGGQSAEHDVSRVTAVAVARALDPEKYEVVPVGITTDGRWLLAGEAQRMLAAGRDALPAAFAVEGDLLPVPSAAHSTGADVVLPLLHGPYGEDGTVQGVLELAGLPYVGAGVLGSAVAMDKIAMKRMFDGAGLVTARGIALRDGHDVDEFVGRVEAELGFPCFVKPANMGSSIGVSKARANAELRAAIAHAFTYDEWVLVEEMVSGREIEVGILGDDPPVASLPGEVVPAADFYDYADKYEDGKAELRAPAPLSPGQTAEVQRLAVLAFDALRGEAMARVDFFLRADGVFVVNEVNTIPGFTPISMYPRLWEVSGVPYAELLDRLIDLAIARSQRRAARRGRQR
ncbi:MAG TPA: D-alanine--D-alanine ligase family protein [Acidimicrobiia bacterium]|jgi:D-alanine-D-alanine ligase|nr:D-alanine--D-alanine ligase family protein [Acidimicrobiia bacterium]